MSINIGLLLSAGYSTRFQKKEPKQLYKIDNTNKHLIELSLNTMYNTLDKIIIITNDKCYEKIKIISEKYNNVVILINNENSRIKSIQIGLNYIIKLDNILNIIIHDSARPYILKQHITNMIEISETYQYSQYYMKLTNGLAKITSTENLKCEIVDRNEYIEICTPICIKKELLVKLDIKEPINEFIDVLNNFKIEYKLIESTHKYLKKITTSDDI